MRGVTAAAALQVWVAGYAQNAINWLAGEEDLIALRPRKKEIGREQVFLSAGQASTALLIGVVLVPGTALLLAAVAGVRRRRSA